MNSAAANSQFAPDDEFSLTKFLVYSGALHAVAALAIAASIYFHFNRNQWAGEGGDLGGTKVSLVSAAGIPMPRPIIPTQSQVADPTQGLNEVEPPKLEPPPPDVTKLPQFSKDKPLPPSHKSKVFENKTPPPANAVPYGRGGSPDLPTGYSQNPGSSSGVAIQGQGGGDFATRYGWYVAAARRRIQPNWDPLSIDAGKCAPPRPCTAPCPSPCRAMAPSVARALRNPAETSPGITLACAPFWRPTLFRPCLTTIPAAASM